MATTTTDIQRLSDVQVWEAWLTSDWLTLPLFARGVGP